jgi:hypothetical protein
MAGFESEESDILMQRCGVIPKPNDASKVDGYSVAMMEEQSRKQEVGRPRKALRKECIHREDLESSANCMLGRSYPQHRPLYRSSVH